MLLEIVYQPRAPDSAWQGLFVTYRFPLRLVDLPNIRRAAGITRGASLSPLWLQPWREWDPTLVRRPLTTSHIAFLQSRGFS